MDRNEILNSIRTMLSPWIKEGDDQVFFHVSSSVVKPIGGRDLSYGLLMSQKNDGNDTILFETRFPHESTGTIYRTINGKPLKDLSDEELSKLHSKVTEYIKKENIYPAVFGEYYSDELSAENEWFNSIDFGRPVDGEILSLSEYIEDVDGTKVILPDLDASIYFAEKVSSALEHRNHVWSEMMNDHRLFHVTLESDDPRIAELALKYDGEVEVTQDNDIPLTMATFWLGGNARKFHDDIHRVLDTAYYRTTPMCHFLDFLKNNLTPDNNEIAFSNPVSFKNGPRSSDLVIRDARRIFMEKDDCFYIGNKSKKVPVTGLSNTNVHVLMDRLASDAVHDRIVTASARSFSPIQRDLLRHLLETNNSNSSELMHVFENVLNHPEVASCPDEWKDDVRNELKDLAEGVSREQSNSLRI